MKIRKKWGCITAMLLLFVVAAVFCLHWAWKYYGLPELPDRREYKTIEERAEKALAFARRHNMNEHYALFVHRKSKARSIFSNILSVRNKKTPRKRIVVDFGFGAVGFFGADFELDTHIESGAFSLPFLTGQHSYIVFFGECVTFGEGLGYLIVHQYSSDLSAKVK